MSVISPLNHSGCNNSISPVFNIDERMDELRQKIHKFGTRLGISQRILEECTLSFDSFSLDCGMNSLRNIILVPPWFLFHYEDIPAQFRVTDLLDPRVSDHQFLNDLADWMNEKISAAGLTSLCRQVDFWVLQKVIVQLSDSNLSELSKDFGIAHEMAHLAHWREIQDPYIWGISISIIFLALTLVLLPFAQITLTLAGIGIAMGVSSASTLINLFHIYGPTSLSGIEKEKKADLDGARAMNDASGAIFYFSIALIHNIATRISHPSLSDIIDANGNDLRDTSHPPFSERIAYLRAWQSENSH